MPELPSLQARAGARPPAPGAAARTRRIGSLRWRLADWEKSPGKGNRRTRPQTGRCPTPRRQPTQATNAGDGPHGPPRRPSVAPNQERDVDHIDFHPRTVRGPHEGSEWVDLAWRIVIDPTCAAQSPSLSRHVQAADLSVGSQRVTRPRHHRHGRGQGYHKIGGELVSYRHR